MVKVFVHTALLYFTVEKLLHKRSSRQSTVLEQHGHGELLVLGVLGWHH